MPHGSRWTKLALAAAVALAVPGSARAERRTWTVHPGDALSIIAERFGVSVEQIREWNALDGDVIRIGQELVVSDEGAGEGEGSAHPEHVVAAGETLSGIAVAHGVTVEQILEWNDGLDADHVREGQTIRVGTPRFRIEHEVRRGESLSSIAERYGVTVHDVLLWNRGVSRSRLLAGRTLVVYSDRAESSSESVGLPHDGHLLHGERLSLHPGYIIRDRERAYGTRETCDAIAAAFDAMQRADPHAPKLRIHDLSARDGGPLADHRSHQSGRDADITYYQVRGCRSGDGCPMRRLSPADLDAERTWQLVHYWLERDMVEEIFVDYTLQEPLYQEARRQGATRAQLSHWFQYPRGRTYPYGKIRHFPLHRDHMHVRFHCPESDESCREQ